MNVSKTPVLLSVAYNPPIAWFSLLAKHNVVLESHETYPKQTFRNRCEIYAENGRMPLSIPVSRPKGNHTQINDVTIVNSDKWYLRHWRAIQSAYESSPYFLFYKDDLKGFYEGNYEGLFDFNTRLIRTIAGLLNLQTHIRVTDMYEKTPIAVKDYRNLFNPKKEIQFAVFPEYIQVFSERHGFIPNLSILDLLFNLGPESSDYLNHIILPF